MEEWREVGQGNQRSPSKLILKLGLKGEREFDGMEEEDASLIGWGM